MTIGKLVTLFREYKKDHGINDAEEKPKERIVAF